MALIKWSAATDLENIATAPLQGLSVSGTAELADIDNTNSSDRRLLNCMFRISLASLNPSGLPSMTIRMYRKVGGVGPSRSATVFAGESFIIPMLTGAGARVYDSPVFRLVGPFVFGVEIINNTNTNFASSGNSVIPTVWTEDV